MVDPAINTIRIVLADDQQLFREALRSLLAAQPGFEVVGEAGDGEQVVQLVSELHPDVVLMDVLMPVLDGVAATRRLRAEQPDCHIIMLTTFDDDEYVIEGLRAGAIGYLLKDAPTKRLVEAVQMAARGETFLQPSIAAKVVAELNRQLPAPGFMQRGLVEPLTPREVDILRMIARGSSNREIATHLVITEGTVKNHVTSILGKLGVRDRTQAVLKAQELRLV
jgi:DNA-binding NarL/FixJ family response regulator